MHLQPSPAAKRLTKALLMVIGLIIPPMLAAAETAEMTRRPGPLRAELTYEVFTFGGMVLAMDADFASDGKSFQARTRSQSRGFIDVLFPFTSEVETTGTMKLEPGRPSFAPERHDARTTGRFASRRSVTMTWDPNRLPVAEVLPTPTDDDRDPVPADKIRGTVDPLTAAIGRAMISAGGDPCSGTDQIFDGRRRYNLHFSPAGSERLEPFKLAAYSGDTAKCRIKFERVAGYMKQYEERNRKADEAETYLWVAQDGRDNLWFPVRLQSDGFFGPVNGYLVRAVVNGQLRFEKKDGTTAAAGKN